MGKMTYEEFDSLVRENQQPVILVEGTRDLCESHAETLVEFGKRLATVYPHAIFRTGNAMGSDEAFAKGIKSVDSSRLQYVLPYAGHRQNTIDDTSCQIAVTDMSDETQEKAVCCTSDSSPEYRTMMAKRNTVPKLREKARYILRDTIKVIGAIECALSPATVGIFYVNQDNPMKGGTGHTIRVCGTQGVPVAFQDEWTNWPSLPKM